jgi:hypothetical protein
VNDPVPSNLKREADASGDADADIDVDLLMYLQTLTPDERLQRHDSALQLVLALREAGRRHYGFDPRAVAEAGDGEG